MVSGIGADFEAWYQREHPGLITTLAVVVGDADLAAESVDEALARAYERWAGLRTPTAWTYRVALNVARRKVRRRTVEARLLRRVGTMPDLPGPAGELWLLVADLPPRQREAVALRHIGHLTETEVAEAMGVARGTVSATLRTAHQALRVALEPHLDEEVSRG